VPIFDGERSAIHRKNPDFFHTTSVFATTIALRSGDAIRAERSRAMQGAQSSGQGNQALDVGAIVGRIQRLARLDTTVFDEVRYAASETIPALAVVIGSTLLSAIGVWLWLTLEFDGLDAGQVILKLVVLGTAVTVGAWALWALVTQVVLLNVFGVQADRMSLIRCMGYAAAPAGGMLLMLFPTIGLGIGIAATVAWFTLTNYAIQAAAPAARPNQVVLANIAGFLVFALLMALLADATAWSPGLFIYGASLSEYF